MSIPYFSSRSFLVPVIFVGLFFVTLVIYFCFDSKFNMGPNMGQIFIRKFASKTVQEYNVTSLKVATSSSPQKPPLSWTVKPNPGPSTWIPINLIWFLKSEFRKNEPSESTSFNLPPRTTLYRDGFGRDRAAQMLFIVLFIVWFSK